MKILVCDDQKSRCEEVVDEIRSAGQPAVSALPGAELTAALKEFFKGVQRYLGDGKASQPFASRFDCADVVIIDNNLAHLDIEGARLTAESIVGYLRAFSSAAYFVCLNKNPDVDFDLRYLIGDHTTHADVALNTKHLGIPGLWTGAQDGRCGFLPWYWPTLSTAASRRRNQIDWVRSHLDKPVLGEFEFPATAVEILSRHAKGTLSPLARSGASGTRNDGKRSEEITFRDMFSTSTRSLPNVEDRNVIQGRDTPLARRIMSRIVASDLDLWFRRDVLGPQEVLVDVPHLLLRMPFLLGKKAGDPKGWKTVAQEQRPPFGLDRTRYAALLKGSHFRYEDWVGRPCFWWPILRENEGLNRLFTTSDPEWAVMVFCEDTSGFESRSGSGERAPREFVAEFEGTWERRHVLWVKGFKYAPRSRLAL